MNRRPALNYESTAPTSAGRDAWPAMWEKVLGHLSAILTRKLLKGELQKLALIVVVSHE